MVLSCHWGYDVIGKFSGECVFSDEECEGEKNEGGVRFNKGNLEK